MNFNCSNFLDLGSLQEQVMKAFCYQKLFWPFTVVWTNCTSDLKILANSWPSATNFKSFSRSLKRSVNFKMSLWNHRLDQNTNKNFDSLCPGPFRAEIIKFFVGILVQTKTSKRHFEISWPLQRQLWIVNYYVKKFVKKSL